MARLQFCISSDIPHNFSGAVYTIYEDTFDIGDVFCDIEIKKAVKQLCSRVSIAGPIDFNLLVKSQMRRISQDLAEIKDIPTVFYFGYCIDLNLLDSKYYGQFRLIDDSGIMPLYVYNNECQFDKESKVVETHVWLYNKFDYTNIVDIICQLTAERYTDNLFSRARSTLDNFEDSSVEMLQLFNEYGLGCNNRHYDLQHDKRYLKKYLMLLLNSFKADDSRSVATNEYSRFERDITIINKVLNITLNGLSYGGEYNYLMAESYGASVLCALVRYDCSIHKEPRIRAVLSMILRSLSHF